MVFGIDFPGDGDDVATLNTVPDLCAECYDNEGIEIELRRETRYNGALGGYIEVFVCPECGREVMASEDITTPDGERF